MWQNKDNKLYKKYILKDFNQAIDFINKIAVVANTNNHHPTIKITWNKVELSLSTHEAGDIVTDKDEQLAEEINNIFDNLKIVESTINLPEYNKIKLYCDGGSRGNPGPSASGFVIMDENDHILYEEGIYLGITTNNQAEYNSLKFGLRHAVKLSAKQVDVYMDSMLVVNQMTGIYKIKNRELLPVHDEIKRLVKSFDNVNFTYIPRELNKLADAEVNKCLDAQKTPE